MVVALALGAVTTVMAQQGVELSELSVITATVVAIDRVDRNVTLRGPDGNVVTVEVGYEARNFDQIEIGDQVKVEYYEAVAMYIGKHGQKPDAVAGLVTARAAKGDKPAGVAVEVVDVAATVHAIDKKKRTVTLKGPDGRLVKTKVDKSVKGFDTLKVGDTIHARFTEGFRCPASALLSYGVARRCQVSGVRGDGGFRFQEKKKT
jgi:hypothetical protein